MRRLSALPEDDPARRREEQRVAAIGREYRAKIDDLARQYAMRVTVAWVQTLELIMPVQRFEVQIRRRKAQRVIHLDWNPLARQARIAGLRIQPRGRTPAAGLRRRDPSRHAGGTRALRQLRQAVLPRLPPGALPQVRPRRAALQPDRSVRIGIDTLIGHGCRWSICVTLHRASRISRGDPGKAGHRLRADRALPPPPSGTAGKRDPFRSIPVTKCARGFRRGRDSGHVEAGRSFVTGNVSGARPPPGSGRRSQAGRRIGKRGRSLLGYRNPLTKLVRSASARPGGSARGLRRCRWMRPDRRRRSRAPTASTG